MHENNTASVISSRCRHSVNMSRRLHEHLIKLRENKQIPSSQAAYPIRHTDTHAEGYLCMFMAAAVNKLANSFILLWEIKAKHRRTCREKFPVPVPSELAGDIFSHPRTGINSHGDPRSLPY
jgi:hypothetical protein